MTAEEFRSKHVACQTSDIKFKLPDGKLVTLGPGYEENFITIIDRDHPKKSRTRGAITCRGCGKSREVTSSDSY